MVNSSVPSTPQPAPLLSVSVPLGLQLNNNSQGIAIQGTNNGLILNEDYTFVTNFANQGLTHQTPQGQTIALIANGINLDGGNITAPGGAIDLWSVGEGVVRIGKNNNDFVLSDGGISSYGDLNALNSSSINTSANTSGTIDIHADNITLNNGSIIFSNTRSGNGGAINVNATGNLNLDGIVFDFPQSSPPNIMYSGIAANVRPFGTSRGGAGYHQCSGN
ncbi:MAG: hypothetical protein HC796_02770 [Synechococcaceae cyanobacterium RL_1_2]|nr:hypothetical protein [Synechococcaceae cyanobacterium RL_1_2]